MSIVLTIVAVVAALWGWAVGGVSSSMANGPRQGTRNGGFLTTAIGGLVVGLVGGAFTSTGVVAGAGLGLLVALVAFSLALGAIVLLKR